MRSDSVSITLTALLDANVRFDLEARGTTNHLPMALVAMARMGATPARLRAFFDLWERKYALPAPPVDIVVARERWADHLGDRAAFGALRVRFEDWIHDVGSTAVITAVLRRIPFAPATQAFHSLIRLAYGIEAGHGGEIASGLASLVSSHLPIPVDLIGRPAAQSIEAGFERVTSALAGLSLPQTSITGRVRAVASNEAFGSAMLAPPVDVTLLDDVARTMIAMYWHVPNFTLLHTVTATHAARIVFSELDEHLVNRLLPDFWIALCAAIGTVGTVGMPAATDKSTLDLDIDWSEVCRMAVASDDDHVVKMTYTCFCEDQRVPSPLYLAAAARLVSPDIASSNPIASRHSP